MAKQLGDIVGSHANQAHSCNKLVSTYIVIILQQFTNETAVVRVGKSCFSSRTYNFRASALCCLRTCMHDRVCTYCMYNYCWYNVPRPGVGEPPRPLLLGSLHTVGPSGTFYL
jgi:hypothetical protein